MKKSMTYLVITRGTVDDLPIAVVNSYAEAERIALDFDAEHVGQLPATPLMLGDVKPGAVNYVDVLVLKHGRPCARLLHHRVNG